MSGKFGESSNQLNTIQERRRRLHELLIALINQQETLELMDMEEQIRDGSTNTSSGDGDPARWLNRNRRILSKYQSLVRSAITMDALMDSEDTGSN